MNQLKIDLRFIVLLAFTAPHVIKAFVPSHFLFSNDYSTSTTSTTIFYSPFGNNTQFRDTSERPIEELRGIAFRKGYDTVGMDRDGLEMIANYLDVEEDLSVEGDPPEVDEKSLADRSPLFGSIPRVRERRRDLDMVPTSFDCLKTPEDAVYADRDMVFDTLDSDRNGSDNPQPTNQSRLQSSQHSQLKPDTNELTIEELRGIAFRKGYDTVGMDRDGLEMIANYSDVEEDFSVEGDPPEVDEDSLAEGFPLFGSIPRVRERRWDLDMVPNSFDCLKTPEDAVYADRDMVFDTLDSDRNGSENSQPTNQSRLKSLLQNSSPAYSQLAKPDTNELTIEELKGIAFRKGYDTAGMDRDGLEMIANYSDVEEDFSVEGDPPEVDEKSLAERPPLFGSIPRVRERRRNLDMVPNSFDCLKTPEDAVYADRDMEWE